MTTFLVGIAFSASAISNLETWYGTLGAKKTSHTPTKFQWRLSPSGVTIYTTSMADSLRPASGPVSASNADIVDFTSTVNYPGKEFSVGTYIGYYFELFPYQSFVVQGYPPSSVALLKPEITFTVPETVGGTWSAEEALANPYWNGTAWATLDQTALDNYYSPSYGLTMPGDSFKHVVVSGDRKTVTVSPHLLLPPALRPNKWTGVPPGMGMDTILRLAFNGTTSEAHLIGDSTETAANLYGWPDATIPKFGTGPFEIDAPVIVSPFTPIIATEDITYVRFDTIWELEDIIERYEGPTSSVDDDI
jgi:hypothetical protein